MSPRGVLAAVILLMLACAGPACGQVRSDGMAGAGSALLTGVDATAVNPARLTDRGGAWLLLGETSFAASNSSFSLADYRKYNGERLTESDEDAILAKVRGARLDAGARGGGRGLTARRGGFAIGTRIRGRADARMPRDLLLFVFDGNTPGESFALEGADGTAQVVGEISASYARAFRAADGPLSMGLSIKLIRGIGYFDLVRAAGDLVTTNDGVTGAGELVARTAQGGWGYGVDLGAWRALGPAWTASLAVQDLAGRVRWGRCVEEHTTTFHVRDATLEDLEDDPDDLVDEATETRGIGAFERRIGPVVVAGVAWKRGRYTGAADLRKSFEQGSGRVRRPLVAAGVEAYVASWLTARGGIGIGGWDDFATALGLTFSPGPVRVDVAMLAPGGLVPFTGRGVGAGIAIGLE